MSSEGMIGNHFEAIAARLFKGVFGMLLMESQKNL